MQTIRQRIVTDAEIRAFIVEGPGWVDNISKSYELYRQANIKLSEFRQNGIRSLKEKVDEIANLVAVIFGS